jgi:4-amino-4-deoxy-L-arabinose transferase-like glycosyltransferase
MVNLFTKDRFLKIIKSEQTIHLCILSFLWIAAFVIIKPFGNYPLSDDWAYAKTVKIFIETHKIQILDWYAMSFITQLFWGALFCFVFGFSFFILRLSTIVIGIIGVVYLYLLIKKLINSNVALLSCLVFAFNPLYVTLSYSFMTDVPFISFIIISLYYYIETIRTERLRYMIIAGIFAILATLLRQMGIILPFTIIIAFLFREKLSKKWLIYSILSCIITVLSLVGLQHYYAATGNLSTRFGGLQVILSIFKNKNIIEVILSREASFIAVTGFLISPLFFVIIPKSKILYREILITLGILLPIIFYWNGLFPGNYINNFNIGPLTFKDSFGSFLIVAQMVKNRPFELIKIVGFIVGFVVILQTVFTITQLFTKSMTIFEKQIKMMVLAFIAAYFLFYISSPIVFDRYSLPLLIFIPILVLPFENIQLGMFTKIVTITMIGIMFCFSIISTHDYFAINTARWKGVDYLFHQKKATIHEIDGGFEVNAWYNYSVAKNNSKPRRNWWWVDDDKYVIALSHLPNYDVDTVFQFKNWIKNSIHKIYVLQRSSAIDTIAAQSTINFESMTKDSTGFITSNQIVQIKSKKNISTISHSGKTALCLTASTADSIYFKLNDIHADDYCEMQFWANTSNLTAKIRVKIFCIFWDEGIEPIRSENGWTLYKTGFYATSGLSGLTDNVAIKIVPTEKHDVLIDDVKLFLIKKDKNEH